MFRTDFYNKVTNSGITEYDWLNNNISKFVTVYPVSYYRVGEADIMRPDLISWRVYGTEAYWWLILSYNKVQDPLNELTVGQLLKIPNKIDIYEFYKKYSIR